LLRDFRRIVDDYGFPGTFTYAQNYLDFEQYFTFAKETFLSCALSIVAVLIVIIFITASVQVTFLVAFSVLLVDYLLMALVHFWSLTFNSVVVVQIVIAIGLSVDYSAHIAHTYLLIKCPPECDTDEKKRFYKAKTAISQMGSSVFHGGFSTFLSIAVLYSSRSYVFVVFFRMWFGIILFGMSNGFLLLPVILSRFGPVEDLVEEEVAHEVHAIAAETE